MANQSSIPEQRINSEVSTHRYALIAGFGLLFMSFLAPFALFSILQNIIVPRNPEKTVANIVASKRLFNSSILAFLFVIVLDIIVAWGLYFLLKKVNESISLLAAWFRVVYAACFLIAVCNLHHVIQLVNSASSYLSSDQLAIQVMLSVESALSGWGIGLGIFGFHLILLGVLIIKLDLWILGILVMISGFGYTIDTIGKIMITDYNLDISMYTFIGEIGLMLWLFWRGIKETQILKQE